MFNNAWGIIDRSKRGIAITGESIRFAVKNLDVVCIYLIGAVVSTLLAVGVAAIPFGLGVSGRVELFIILSLMVSVGVYAFTMFFWHGIAVHLIGSRMLGETLHVRTAVSDVLDRPGIFGKWAVITTVVKMLAVLSNMDDEKKNSTIQLLPQISVLSLYRTATFFIHPTLLFYSLDETKAEISQALSVYAKRIIEVLAMKTAMTIVTVILVIVGVAMIVCFAVLLPVLAVTATGSGIGIVGVFVATPVLAGAAILFLAGIAWSVDKLLFDIGKTAVYLDSEAPVVELHGFDQAVIHPDDGVNREDIFRSNAPQAVINRFQSWSGDGSFQHRV